MTKFYTYNQNNSGGHFEHKPDNGIGKYVIIEADSAKEANDKAEEIGLYFDGCESGRDCDCCGDRWYSKDDDSEGYTVPSIYGQPVAKRFKEEWEIGSYIHYKDGTIKRIKEINNA